jgi:hypothetical protein
MSETGRKRHISGSDLINSGPSKKTGIIESESQSSSGHQSMDHGIVNVPTPPPPKQVIVPDHSRNAPVTFGILTHLSRTLEGPSPVHDDVYVVVNSANFVGYFESLYETIIHLIYPDFDPAAAVGVISEENFVLVCRYLMKARCDHVYGRVTGRRPPRRIPVPSDMAVPAALALVINGIGSVVVDSGAYPVIPQPEAINAQDANANLDVLITHNILGAFTNFVKAASNRGLINAGFLSTVTEGTPYWLLSARDSTNAAIVAGQNANHCRVYAVFKEWTPSDAMLASITLIIQWSIRRKHRIQVVNRPNPCHRWPTCHIQRRCINFKIKFF